MSYVSHDGYVNTDDGYHWLTHLDCEEPIKQIQSGDRLSDLQRALEKHVCRCAPGATDSPEIRITTDYTDFGRMMILHVYKLADGEPTHILRYARDPNLGLVHVWAGLDDTSIKPDPTLRVSTFLGAVELYNLREYVTGNSSYDGDLNMTEETFAKARLEMEKLARLNGKAY